MPQIYKTTNLLNGKIYVGQDSFDDPEYLGSGLYLQRSIRKHGSQNFIKEVIEFCEISQLDEKEIYWIEALDARNPAIGYNFRVGGNGIKGGSKLSKEHTEAIGIGITRKWKEDLEWAKAQIASKKGIFDPAVKIKANQTIAKNRIGTHLSEETRSRISKDKIEKGVWIGDKNPMHGTDLYTLLLQKYGKEEADKKWEDIVQQRNESRKTYFERYEKEFGEEEAKKRKDAEHVKRSQAAKEMHDRKIKKKYAEWVEKFGEVIADQKMQEREERNRKRSKRGRN